MLPALFACKFIVTESPRRFLLINTALTARDEVGRTEGICTRIIQNRYEFSI